MAQVSVGSLLGDPAKVAGLIVVGAIVALGVLRYGFSDVSLSL